jgi:hypothetical protein
LWKSVGVSSQYLLVYRYTHILLPDLLALTVSIYHLGSDYQVQRTNIPPTNSHEPTMLPFHTPDPTTYAALLNILRDEASLFHITQSDLDCIRDTALHIAHYQANHAHLVNCHSCGEEALLAPYIRRLISDLEALGVQGWVKSLEERGWNVLREDLGQALGISRRQAGVLREKEGKLPEDMETLESNWGKKARVAVREEELGAAGLSILGDVQQLWEESEKLREVTGRLEKLAGLQEVDINGSSKTNDNSVHEDFEVNEVKSGLSEDETSSVKIHTERHTPHSRTYPFSASSGFMEASSSGVRLPTMSAASAGSSNNPESPPSLHPLTGNGKEDDEKNESYPEENNTIWSHEQKETQESSLPVASSTSTLNRSLSAESRIDSTPPYIFIPLPANFTLLQHNSHLPFLTFKTPPSVLHFPQRAKKDELLAVLHERCAAGLLVPDLESLDGVNVMQVCTHHMEWELKNAIRKSITQTQWDTEIGRLWYTEGKGDTYIVSRRDMHFHGVSGTAASSHDESGLRSHPNMSEKGRSEYRGQEQTCLRSSASSPNLKDPKRHSLTALGSGPGAFNTPDHYRETLYDVDGANEFGFQRAYLEHARILQLQNASQNRMIERLQHMIKDMEETFDWQENMLDAMHHRVEHWKDEAAAAEQDGAQARKEVEAARMETDELRTLMEEINMQIVGFYEQLEIKLGEIEKEELEGSVLPVIRGGAGTTDHTSRHTKSEGEETCPYNIEATAFYFFPSVSIMVLLTNPLRYFQWPRRTTLLQARDILRSRHMNGLETNPYLQHIHGIMELREEKGLALPDTSDNRQILIALPVFKSESEDRGATGRGSRWEGSFGPDHYERMLREQLDGLEIPESNGRSHLSSSSGGEDETFNNPHGMVNLINEEIGTACTSVRSCNICGENRYSFPCSFSVMPTGPPPTKMPASILYPSVPNRRPLLGKKRTKSIVPEHSEHLHPARMPQERMWNVVRYPNSSTRENEYTECELDRSANYDYELGIGGHAQFARAPVKGRFQAGSDWQKEVDDAELEKWRHGKGKGCESWLNQTALDPERSTCTFCDLPWAEGMDREWGFAVQRRPRSTGVCTPMNFERSPPESGGRLSPLSSPTHAETKPKGGAGGMTLSLA